jgi:tetratricopeptide (TPR) repeat protein
MEPKSTRGSGMFMLNALLAAGLALQTATATPMATAPVAVAAEMPPPPAEVMAIPEGLRRDLHERVMDGTNSPELRLRRMVDFMFAKDGLDLKYKADATNSVAESYRTRQVNCLSFTLMAVALAREAGLKAQGQQIDRVLAWSLVDDVVMQSMHANAVVTVKDRNLQVKDGRDFVLDIASGSLYTQDFIVHGFKVEDKRLLASFYGNRAMELLAQGRLDESKAWLDEALVLEPDEAMLLNNAGVLSQRAGDVAAAESAFLRAVNRNPRLMSVLNNLVAMYSARGDATRATYWKERADSVLRRDPFYQYSVAERYAEAGNHEEAVRYYRRAIALDSRERLFHFGLARAYTYLGRLGPAAKELDAAVKLSTEDVDRQRFQAKLDALRGMAVR